MTKGRWETIDAKCWTSLVEELLLAIASEECRQWMKFCWFWLKSRRESKKGTNSEHFFNRVVSNWIEYCVEFIARWTQSSDSLFVSSLTTDDPTNDRSLARDFSIDVLIDDRVCPLLSECTARDIFRTEISRRCDSALATYNSHHSHNSHRSQYASLCLNWTHLFRVSLSISTRLVLACIGSYWWWSAVLATKPL